MNSVVDRLFEDHKRLVQILEENGQVSLRVSIEATLQKVLVLSAASHFEVYIGQAILDFVATVSRKSNCVTGLVKSKVIERQYHTYFDWDKRNANKFFSLFGTDFKRHMADMVREDEELEAGIQAFLKIGRERNRMVHGDFGVYRLEETTEEIMELYRRASGFVERIPVFLNDACRTLEPV